MMAYFDQFALIEWGYWTNSIFIMTIVLMILVVLNKEESIIPNR